MRWIERGVDLRWGARLDMPSVWRGSRRASAFGVDTLRQVSHCHQASAQLPAQASVLASLVDPVCHRNPCMREFSLGVSCAAQRAQCSHAQAPLQRVITSSDFDRPESRSLPYKATNRGKERSHLASIRPRLRTWTRYTLPAHCGAPDWLGIGRSRNEQSERCQIT